MSKRIQTVAALNINYRDAGPWRSYEVSAEGFSELDLISSALIIEIDQDGGEIKSYPLENASHEVYAEAVKQLLKVHDRASKQESA